MRRNDGLGGGLLVHQNVLFNACRDSGDHVGWLESYSIALVLR